MNLPHGVDINHAAKHLAETLPPLSEGQWHVGFRPTNGEQSSGSTSGSCGRFFFFLWHRGEAKDQRWDHPGGDLRVLSQIPVRLCRIREPHTWAR